ncbi:MAG: hypothetical protein R2713_10085 [Ilumatobacteraceae bacterium]
MARDTADEVELFEAFAEPFVPDEPSVPDDPPVPESPDEPVFASVRAPASAAFVTPVTPAMAAMVMGWCS